MKNNKNVEEVKKVIMKDLFFEVKHQKCVIDILLQESEELEKYRDSFNKVSIVFLNKCRLQLEEEANKGNILFFRMYKFETKR